MIDQHTMATKSNEVNPTIPVTIEKQADVVPGNFHEFSGNQAKMYTTYENRMEKIASALGGKAPVKG